MAKALANKVGGLRNNEFIKVSSWSAFATFFKMLASFISIKVVSGLIGPAGIALLGQFMNSATIISNLGSGCINQGVTKYIAEHSDDQHLQRKVIANALRLTLISSLFIMALVLLFYRQIGQYIFKSAEYNRIIVFFGLTLMLFSVNLVLVSIINGFKAFKKFVAVNIASSFLSLLITVPVVYYFGVAGALVSFVLSQTVIIFVTLLLVRKEPWFGLMLSRERLDPKVVRMLLGFTLMAAVSAVAGPYVQLFIRGHIITRLSVTDAGIWEGVNRLSAMYLLFVTTSISTYYLPKLSEIKNTILLRNEILKACKIVLPPLALFCFLLFVCRDLIIHLVFTEEFLRMRELFAVQLVGDFFKIASWLFAYVFWAKAMTRIFIITEVVFSCTLCLFSYFFINRFGFEGTVYGYALNYCLYFFTCLFILRKLLFHGK
jgi:O-antigen/teichoic acid export membrane protein